MNTNALRLFLRIMQRGTLVAAATDLNMSPSAASRLLSSLERETGLTLFTRDGKRLRATAEGNDYFKECYRVLVAVDELPKTAKRLASGAKARLRLLSNPRFATALMNPTIGRLLKRNPDIEIDLQIAIRYEVELTVTEGAFDIGITALPLKHISVQTEPLLDMPAIAVMRRDHALAGRRFVHLADLVNERLIATPPGTHLRQDVDAMFAADGLEFHPQITIGHVDVGCNAVQHTGAILISDPLIPLVLHADAYVLVPLRPVHVLRVGLVTPVLNPASRSTVQFKQCLRDEAKSIQQRLARQFRNLK